jgi:hypothetical protein
LRTTPPITTAKQSSRNCIVPRQPNLAGPSAPAAEHKSSQMQTRQR